jgi:hypothetical protein
MSATVKPTASTLVIGSAIRVSALMPPEQMTAARATEATQR